MTVDDSLGIGKVGPATVTPEGVLAYQIVVSNGGPSDATNVVVSDTLPSALQNVIASASSGACSIAGSLLTCTVARLPVGGQAFIAIQGTVARSASGTLVNTARVTSAADPTGVSSTASTTVVTSADLELVKRGPATAQPGATVVYTLTLRNLGPSTAADVVLTDTLPAGLTFAAASAGCVNTSGTVVCTVGSLAADTTVVRTVTATVNAGVQPGASLENAATVSTSSTDPNPLNNAATADTSIVGAADLTISKSGSPASVNGGRDRDLHDPHHQHRPRPGAQRGRERPASGGLDLSLSLGLERRGVRRVRCASSARWRSGRRARLRSWRRSTRMRRPAR